MFVLADLEAGGAQRVILTVLRHLDREKFRPHLCIVDSSGPLRKEIPENLTLHDLGAKRVRYSLPGIVRLTHSIEPVAVVSTLGHLNLALLGIRRLLPRNTRLIIREANTPSSRLRQEKNARIYEFLYKRFYPSADRVICNSQYMEKDLQSCFSLHFKKTTVIPNPVDSKRIQVALQEASSPYKPDVINLVSVGRLNYQKGFDLLLRAYGKVLCGFPRLHLTIVGDGREKEYLKRLCSELGIEKAVTLTGHRDDPFRFMAHADMYISSSRYEGLPNTVLESLCCGTPVLAFDCPGGTSEIVREGENGWLIPPEDIEALAEAVSKLVKERRWESLNKDRLLPDRFLCEKVVREYEALLAEP